ncbi:MULTISPECIES: GH25 family lysozyme [unclassified Butyrivibrio]|uniref:GH25 family lysozyme n=1 Tax=unclassified Butyrivibrio TaxID=2639466 RepID=UPI000428E29B|nr:MULTISPECIES: GH25 family lysozyme [unclassified Butyrivibrio]
MKRSLKLFNKIGKKPRRRQDVKDYDEEFEEDYYEDEEYDEEFEEEYGDEDYRDDDEDYRDEDYPEDDYPEEDYPEDRSYSREKHGDFDQELREDDDFDVDTNRKRYEDEYPEEDKYSEEEEYPEEDEYPEDVVAEDSNVVPFPVKAESEPEDDYSDEDYFEEESYETDSKYEDSSYSEEAKYRDELEDAEDGADYRDEVDYEDEDYDPEFEEDYGDQVEGRYKDEDDYPDEEDDRYEDEDDYPEDDIDDRYDDERDYRDAEDYDRYEEEYDEDYGRYDEDYRDDEDDYYAAAAVARGGRGGRDSGRSSRASKADKKSGRDKKDRDRRRRGGSGAGAKIIEFVKNTSFAERAAAIVAILLVIGGLITMSFYRDALGRTAEINSFAEVGAGMQFDDVIGSTGLLAVADAERARAMTAGIVMEEEEEEEEEVADDAQGVTIKMTLTTIKSDMKIKFINSETNKLVANVPFTVDVVTPDGTKVTYDDHDKDGIIYKNNLTAGKYKVTPNALPSEFSNYALELGTQSLTIKDTVETKVVDVSNEIKKESQVNAAKEDTAVQEVVESALTDTVEWVDSNQGSTSSGSGNYNYEQINKDTIADPSTSSMIPTGTIRRLSASRGRTEGASTDASTEGSTVAGAGRTGDDTNPDDAGNNGSGEGGSQDSGSGSSSGDGVSTDASVETPKDMTVSISSSSLEVGQTANISVSGPSSFTCTSSDEAVATVSNDGTVTAKGEGSATITVKADGYNNGSVSVSVKKAEVVLKDMTLSSTNINMKVGEKTKLTATGPSSVTFRSSADNIAAVGSDGTIEAKAEGKATITVTADGYKDATATVNVAKADEKLITFTSSPSPFSIAKDATGKLTVSGIDANAVTFKSSDEKIATVAKDGTVKGVAEGKATITISASGYKDATIEVTVTKNSDKTVEMNATKVTLVQGRTFKLAPKDAGKKVTYSSAKSDIASVGGDGTITGVGAGSATITFKCDGYKDGTVEVTVISKTTVLKDKNGNTVYVKNANGDYVEATYDDYYKGSTFYLRKEKSGPDVKQGWWTIDGKTYYFDKNGNYVTGEQVIKGAKYTFGSDGALSSSSGTLGIDVSKWNGNIDWNKVKNNGVNFVIIRCGYRGSSAGALIEDPKFRANIKGAQAAGLRVGVYFFSQAVNEVEAVEEASMCINLCKGYSLSFPIYIDVEGSNGRGDTISASQRTANIKAFCGTIQSAGYRAGVYSNKTWFTKNINTASLTNYKIWLAQYAANVSYTATRYDMWQYTSKGSVSGISGNVDMNILYN